MATAVPRAPSGVGAFWAWWTGELRDLLPTPAPRPAMRPEAVIVLLEGRVATVAVRRRRKLMELGRLSLPEPGRGEAAVAATARDPATRALLRAVRRSRLPVVLRLPASTGLVVRDLLPSSAERDLAPIMAHKVDLLTPWSAEQVHVDQRIDRRRGDGQLEVSLMVAPRAQVDEARRRLAALGLETQAVDLVEEDPWAAPSLDLIHGPGSRRRGKGRAGLLLGTLLALLAVGGVVAGQRIWARERLIETRRQLAETLEQRLGDLPELRSGIEALRGEARFIGERQRAAASPLVVLETLSRILPDNVWLTELSLNGNQLTIGGYAADATAVVTLIEDAPLFSGATFRAPSTRERVPLPEGGEREVSRFLLAAKVEPERSLPP
jgi:general secretion pathway protein L